jgi:hypothetical protein
LRSITGCLRKKRQRFVSCSPVKKGSIKTRMGLMSANCEEQFSSLATRLSSPHRVRRYCPRILIELARPERETAERLGRGYSPPAPAPTSPSEPGEPPSPDLVVRRRVHAGGVALSAYITYRR